MVSVWSAHHHTLRHNVSKLSWLQVSEDNAEFIWMLHLLERDKVSHSRSNLPELIFSNVDLFEVKLLGWFIGLALNNFSNSEIASIEPFKFWWALKLWRFSFSSFLICWFLLTFPFLFLWCLLFLLFPGSLFLFFLLRLLGVFKFFISSSILRS